MSTPPPHDPKSDAPDGEINNQVQINTINAAGNVFVVGRDAYVNDADQHNQTIIIGGVSTTREEAQQLNTAINHIEQAIDREQLDDAARDAARQNAQVLRTQLTSPKKPNEHLLVQAAEALYRFGPNIAGAVVAAFTTPLAGQIVADLGRRALDFYRSMVSRPDDKPELPDSDIPLPMRDA